VPFCHANMTERRRGIRNVKSLDNGVYLGYSRELRRCGDGATFTSATK
jgi:hypothetical protein